MSLSELSIRRPVFAWMLMLALLLFGAIAFSRMGVSQLPDVDFPVVSVSVNYEGAAPEVMESDVVDPLEDAMMTVEGITTVSSSARQGSATVSVEFDIDRDINVALQDVQAKVAQAQRLLPREIDPPVISKQNPEDQPILWLSVSSDRHDFARLTRFVRDRLKDPLTTVPGVGEVMLGGYVDPNLRVWIDNEKLNRFELTVGDVLATIRNEHAELPAGQIETPRREYNVRILGEASSVKSFEDIVINERGGRPNYQPIPLKDVAQVEEGLAEVRRISRFNGQTAIGLGIKKQRGSNAVTVARAVKARMAELQKRLPAGMKLNVNFDTTRFIEESVAELEFVLLLAALLTGVVCWFFLGSFSATFNVLLAIPTSIVGAFILLKAAGFTLNTFTLLGLSLAIGIVVDDAIMVLENIVRHREMRKSKVQAALDGAAEISFAAVAATIAIVAIFLPVVFMRGAIGKFFLQFGVTMTVAVLLSLLEALTLTPMRLSLSVEEGKRRTRLGARIDRGLDSLTSGYKRLLTTALDHRWKVILLSVAFFAGSMATIRILNREFVPAQDTGTFLMRLQTPVDASMAFTNAKFMEAEKLLLARPEVEKAYVAVGGFGGGDVNTGVIFLTMKPKGSRGIDPALGHEPGQQEFMETCRKLLAPVPDLKVFVQDLSMRGFGGGRGFPVEFSVRGPDWETLARHSQSLMDRLQKTGLVTDLDSNYRLGKPEIRITPDRMKAAERGVSIRSIGETINVLVGGAIAGKYPMGGHRHDIRVRLKAEDRTQAESLKTLFVRNNRGELVRLSELVRIEERPSLQAIARTDRERAITITANVTAGKSQAEALEAVERISAEILPEDYHAVFNGGAQAFKESFQDLFIALILGIVVAYMVLGSQFNSFIDPVSVLLALPFSISGAFIALALTGQSLNIYSFIGLILLMGIVKKNSILLVEFTNQIRERGNRTIRAALLEACPIRLRPILMTSLATIAAAVPEALALGPGSETRIPMAVTVIGGVLVSTLLTLLVVPCAYSLLAREKRPQAEPAGATSAGEPA